jgi:fucose permease
MLQNSSESIRLKQNATRAAHIAFLPTGVITVLLGPLLPTLIARWTLTDTQAGDLFTAQFAASTVGTLLSGILVTRIGYRFTIAFGVASMGLGVGVLPWTTWPVGLAAVACWGFGMGLAVPACNMMIARVHAERSAAALSLLNFSWSIGAVACPIMLAPFEHRGSVNVFLWLVAIASVLLAIFLSAVPLPPARLTTEASADSSSSEGLLRALISSSGVAMAALFFLYVGVEIAVSGWVAAYAKRIEAPGGTWWVTAPSFFYFAVLVGRGMAARILHYISELKLTRIGLCASVVGIVALLASHSIAGVLASASVVGLGLASVYPVTIAVMARTVGRSSAAVSSVMFALAGSGGAFIPWLVGFASTEEASLKWGLAVPLFGSAAMLALYMRRWPEPDTVALPETAREASDLVH